MSVVQVRVQKQQKQLKKLSISGHAGEVPAGENLVCAGVSSVVVGLLNAIDELANGSCEISVSDEITEIVVLKPTKDLDIILNTGIIQLKTIAEGYPKLIKIKEVSE